MEDEEEDLGLRQAASVVFEECSGVVGERAKHLFDRGLLEAMNDHLRVGVMENAPCSEKWASVLVADVSSSDGRGIQGERRR